MILADTSSYYVSYGVKELLLDVCKTLLGDSVQLTADVEMEKASIDSVSVSRPIRRILSAFDC